MMIKKGATNVTRFIMIADSTDGSPETSVSITTLDLQYIRNTHTTIESGTGKSAAVAKVDAQELSLITTNHTDNKMKIVDGTNSPGLYRVDWPDAAFASGADSVILMISGSGFAPTVEEIQLVDVDPQDQYWGADEALVLRRLDHLVAVAVPADPDGPVDDSIIAKLASKAATANWSDFDHTTDSLEAVRDDQLKVTTGFATADAKNTLEGYLKAVMLNDATVPTNVPDFVPATDSLEALGANVVASQGSGFSGSTDSLEAIRDVIDTLVAPAVVSSSALSGAGFLSDCVTLIRQMVDEPGTDPKYSDADVVELVQTAFSVVIADLNVNSDHPILVRHTLQLVSGTQSYLLPSQVGEVWRVAKLTATNTGLPIYEAWSDNHWSSHQTGFVIEGNVFRLLQDWKSSDELEILYVPMGEPLLHKGTGVPDISLRTSSFSWTVSGSGTNEYYVRTSGNADPSLALPTDLMIDGVAATKATKGSLANKEWDYGDNDTLGYSTVYMRNNNGDPDSEALHFVQTGTATQLIFASSPTDGTLDTRENAYAGYLIRITSDDAGYIQERQITTYDNTTRKATIDPPFQVGLQGTVTYEVLPTYSRLIKHVVCFQAALDILGNEGNTRRMEALMQRFLVKQRALRQLIGKKSSRFPKSMNSDTSDNDNRGGFGWVV